MSLILLVEDDRSLGATLQERLVRENHQVEWVESLHEAEQLFATKNFDLAIFDVGLPDGSGFELAQRLRKKSLAPFIFVTAASDAENRLHGFELGAEEFIPKPFHLKELILRVQHVLHNHALPQRLRVGESEIDYQQMAIRRGAEVIRLARKEFQLLKLLIDSSPAVVSREQILDRVWGEDKFPTQRTIDNIIVRLRQALGDSDGTLIRSVRSVGYQWTKEWGKVEGE